MRRGNGRREPVRDIPASVVREMFVSTAGLKAAVTQALRGSGLTRSAILRQRLALGLGLDGETYARLVVRANARGIEPAALLTLIVRSAVGLDQEISAA